MNDLALVPSTDPILRTPARLVTPEELPELCDPKFLYRVDKLRKKLGGIGLAGPQIGDSRSWFLWVPVVGISSDLIPGEIVINPRVLSRSPATDTMEEGCLSFPGRKNPVARPIEIEVEYYDAMAGYVRTRRLHYLRARVFLHEFDHLQGICIVS
jgi:peptide deformylase